MGHDNHSSLAPEKIYEKLEKGVDSEGLLESIIRMSLLSFEGQKRTS